MTARAAFLFVGAAALVICSATLPAAQGGSAPPSSTPGTMVEYSHETRFQLDLNVSDAVLVPYLPAGWTLNTATQGAAKDANLRVIFTDRVTVNGPDGKPVGKGASQFVYLAVPVKDAGGANVQLVIGGLTSESRDVPGPFGNYLLATTHRVDRTTSTPSTGTGPTMDAQDWNFTAATGEHLELHLKYEKGVGNKGNPGDVRFYSAKNPTMFQISHQEQVLDVLRNTTTNPPDRVKEYSFKGSGGGYARLFEGTVRPLSWDNILWINRSVFAQ